MKKFTYNDYYTECPIAAAVGNAINTCGSNEGHLAKILNDVFKGDESAMYLFFFLCIGYWSEVEYYDDRNKYAVLSSRKLMAHSKELRELVNAGTNSSTDVALNAFGFTMSEHRYLQNQLFHIIENVFQSDDDFVWFKEQQFVYDEVLRDFVPWEDYKKTHSIVI